MDHRRYLHLVFPVLPENTVKFTALNCIQRGFGDRKAVCRSVCPSVRPSVRPSVKRVNCDNTETSSSAIHVYYDHFSLF